MMLHRGFNDLDQMYTLHFEINISNCWKMNTVHFCHNSVCHRVIVISKYFVSDGHSSRLIVVLHCYKSYHWYW